ncbi:unnamed protein product [Cochlearia groenlandica]
MVEDGAESKHPVNPMANNGAESKHLVKHVVDDGSESKPPSWTIMTKASSQDGTPVDFVVNNKQPAKPDWDDVMDVTAQVLNAECEMPKPNSEDTLSMSYEQGRLENLTGKTKVMVKRVEGNLGEGKRKVFMAASQKSPFQGDSAMKRVMQGVVASPALYDPFGPYNEIKAKELLERIAEKE